MGGLLSFFDSEIPFQDDMHVVIVGGGYGGALLAVLLKKKNFCKVTLIDPKDCMVHCVASLRSCVEKDFARNMFVPYSEVFGDTFCRGLVVKVNTEKKRITLDDKSKITYSHLVIATGSWSPYPGKPSAVNPKLSKEEGMKLYSDFFNEISEAERVLCIGGGSVGVEMSAEVKTEFPEKEVILITSGSILVSERLRPTLQKELSKNLETLGVKVITGEHVSSLQTLTMNKLCKDQVVKTKSQRMFTTDFVIPCTGTIVNTDFCKKRLSASLTDNGTLKVDEFLQVKGQDNVFAIGDVTDINEQKLAYTARLHAEILATNLVAEAIKSPKTPYTPGSLVLLIPTGRHGGVGEFKGITLTNFMVKFFKSGDLLTSKIWGDFGLKPPVP